MQEQLMEAARKGDLSEIKRLHEQCGADLNQPDAYGQFPLNATIKCLVSALTAIEKKSDYRKTLLYLIEHSKEINSIFFWSPDPDKVTTIDPRFVIYTPFLAAVMFIKDEQVITKFLDRANQLKLNMEDMLNQPVQFNQDLIERLQIYLSDCYESIRRRGIYRIMLPQNSFVSHYLSETQKIMSQSPLFMALGLTENGKSFVEKDTIDLSKIRDIDIFVSNFLLTNINKPAFTQLYLHGADILPNEVKLLKNILIMNPFSKMLNIDLLICPTMINAFKKGSNSTLKKLDDNTLFRILGMAFGGAIESQEYKPSDIINKSSRSKYKK